MEVFLAHSLHHSVIGEDHGHQMWNGMRRQNGMCVNRNERGIRLEVNLHAYPSC